MLSRPPATVSRAIGPAPRLPSTSPFPFQHLGICRYFTTLWDIIYICLYAFFFERKLCLRCPLFLSISLPFYKEYISLWGQDSVFWKSGWKIPILIAGQREFHVRVSQDRLPALHIYVRNIVDRSSFLCCATWRTTCWPTHCLPLSFMKQQPNFLSFRYPVNTKGKLGWKVFRINVRLKQKSIYISPKEHNI